MHLGYAKHDISGRKSGNFRNGKSSKYVRSTYDEIGLDIPRSRNRAFEAKQVRKVKNSSDVLVIGLSRSMSET